MSKTKIDVTQVNASGSLSSSTFLRGDGAWATPAAAASGYGTPTTYTTNRTLVIGDANTIVLMNSGSAMTLIIPTNASVAFAVGTWVKVVQLGAGAVTITNPGGITINSRGSLMATNGQYAEIELIQTAADVWLVIGDRV